MRAVGGVADVDFGLDAEFGFVALAEFSGEGLGVALLDEVDGASAKSAAGETRADEAGQVLSEGDHGVGLCATSLEVLAIAAMCLGHEAADFGEITLFECLFRGHGTQVFADDVLGAQVRLGLHLAAPFLQIFQRRVAQKGDIATMAVDDGAGSLGLATAGGVIAPGDGVLDHGVGDDQGDVGGDRSQLEAEVAAIQQQGVVFLSVGGDELVHDAAVGADELVFDALAEAGEHGAGIAGADERENGQSGDHFEGGGTGQTGAERHVAPEGEAEGGNLVTLAGENGGDAERVVAPVIAGLGGQGGSIEGLFFLIVFGVEHDFAIGAGRDAGQGGEVNGHRHDEALGVIGVLTDEVDASRSYKDSGFGLESGKVQGT